MSVQIRNPNQKRSFRQVKAIFAIAMKLHNDKDKASELCSSVKTKGEASTLIQTLQAKL